VLSFAGTGLGKAEEDNLRYRTNRLAGVVAVTAVVVGCTAVPAAGSPNRPLTAPIAGAPHQTATSKGARFSRSTIRAINSIALAGMGSSGAPGMEVGVWIPGKGTFTRGYGTDDLATGSPFNLAAHVRMASISKTFTATAALQLVDRGRLKLGDTLNMFCNAIPHCSRIPYVDQITVGQLLGMRAGVYSYSDDGRFNARYDARPTMPFSIRNVVNIIAKHAKQAVKPGTQTHYSNSDY
jgi:D-alanyl-D-alanine carboxypeptidase